MLRLILGRSGSGKTHEIYEELAAHRDEVRTTLLIVPEQFSFETERALLDLPQVQVLSFSRLADAVAKECGGLAGRLMDEVTRTLLMSRALTETEDRLTLYRKQASRADYVRTVLDVAAECRQYAVTPRQLEEAAMAMSQGPLRQKLTELSMIFSAYEALAADSYIDPTDSLGRLANQLPTCDLAKGAHIYVDGFKSFTEPQLRVLAVLIRQAAQITVALGTDTLDTRDEYALFSSVTRTAVRLCGMAREEGVPVDTPRHLTENHRAASAALAAVEAGCFDPAPIPFEEVTDAVTLAPCPDRYEECRIAAREIRRLLREEGWRCRDIAITARDLSPYEGILDTAMQEAGIPYYMDERQDVYSDPLIAAVRSALACVTDGMTQDEMLRLMKTGLLGFSAHSVAMAENYVFLWNLNGKRLKEPWIANPKGMVPADEESGRMLWYLNILRRRVVRPIERLSAALAGSVTGRAFAEAVYRYLQDAHIPRVLRRQVARLYAAGDTATAERAQRMWDILMELLDRFGTALGTTYLPVSRYEKLFSLALSAVDLGSIPKSLDAVQIGSAERMRFSAPRAVWVLGANEGVFPAYPAAHGLFNDRERRTLAEAGVVLADTGDRRMAEERFVAYEAVSAPSERLYISWLCGVGDEETQPSSLVQSVRRSVPNAAILSGDALPESDADAFEQLARRFDQNDGKRAAMYAYFTNHPAYADRLAAMDRAAAHQPAALHSEEIRDRLFSENMTLSPSKVEQFYRCRFAYFCQYGLRVLPRRVADMGTIEFGELAHFVMQEAVPQYVGKAHEITRERVAADAAALMTRYIDEQMGGMEDKPARFCAMTKRLVKIVEALLWQVVSEMRQSRFVPTDYELSVGREIDSMQVDLPNGGRVRVIGKIDRVDTYQKDGVTYVRVVDYKTGPKDFDLKEVAEGLNLQMLIYLFSLWENGQTRYGAPVQPAGLLYLPAALPVIDSRKSDKETEHLKTMRMSGLLLDDPEIVSAMEADLNGVFIPAWTKSNGEWDARSRVASLAKFGKLKERAETLLQNMAITLHEGDIEALPAARNGDPVACGYCPYRAVCGYEPGNAVRELFDTDDVWKKIGWEESEETGEK